MKSRNTPLRFVPLGAFAAVALAAGQAGATTVIPITNAGFEDPAGTGFLSVASTWTSGSSALHSGFGPGAFTGAGLRFGYVNPSPQQDPLSQTLAAAFTVGQTYTFTSFSVTNSNSGDIKYSIGFDPGTGYVELASETLGLAGINAWTKLAGVSYTVGVSGAAIGQNIILGIGSVGATGQGVWFDNASLTYIPEPSAALLGGLGMLALLRRRR